MKQYFMRVLFDQGVLQLENIHAYPISVQEKCDNTFKTISFEVDRLIVYYEHLRGLCSQSK